MMIATYNNGTESVSLDATLNKETRTAVFDVVFAAPGLYKRVPFADFAVACETFDDAVKTLEENKHG